MSFLNKNLGDKPSLVKPIAVVAVIILITLGAFAFFSGEKTSNDSSSSSSENGSELNSTGLNGGDKVATVADVEEVIAKWVAVNPKAILESVANMQKKMAEGRTKDAQKNIGAKRSELLDDKSPKYAPSGYDVTIVEFFDYNCGYCKKANSTVEQLLKEDKRIRVIYKDFPILGAASTEVSKVSVAVNLIDPSAYRKFHNALMISSARTKDAAIGIAKTVGINVEKLKEALKNKDSEIQKIIQDNIALGASVGIQGTPGFIIGDELIPGALEIGTFREKVAADRAK
jgi:protein-disulfide isomerase